jgi:hypothetical protein
MTFSPLAATIVCGVLICLSCSSPRIQPPEFDGDRAYDYLVKQVEFGPRVPGTEASARCRRYMCEHFSQLGLEVDSQVFNHDDSYSRSTIVMVNVVASAWGESDAALVLMAHYDCRPRAEYASIPELMEKPIDGANDGASGVAVLMEMANLFAARKPPCRVDLVLVDGEDWGVTGDRDNYMLGSREFARRGIRDRYRFGIVVDLVGDSDQQIYREAFSERYAKPLNDVIFETAARLGISTFYDSVKHPVLDDHISLNIGGVLSADIIDFDYAYWHTELDTPDKCSGESLANVGRVLAEIVYNPHLWPEK